MKIWTARLRIAAAAVTLCGLATTVLVAEAASGSTSAAAPIAAGGTLPVLVDCFKHGDVRPGGYVFTCADANSYLTGLRWASWAGADAFAAGTDAFNDCVPSCVEGHFHRFPALVVLWRPEPWTGHQEARYFSRMTLILTGNRSYTAGGHAFHLPQTTTLTLSTSGG
jgi:hypothetical protein